MKKEGLGGTGLKWVRVENSPTYSLLLLSSLNLYKLNGRASPNGHLATSGLLSTTDFQVFFLKCAK